MWVTGTELFSVRPGDIWLLKYVSFFDLTFVLFLGLLYGILWGASGFRVLQARFFADTTLCTITYLTTLLNGDFVVRV